jgi:hypothetical protein
MRKKEKVMKIKQYVMHDDATPFKYMLFGGFVGIGSILVILLLAYTGTEYKEPPINFRISQELRVTSGFYEDCTGKPANVYFMDGTVYVLDLNCPGHVGPIRMNVREEYLELVSESTRIPIIGTRQVECE